MFTSIPLENARKRFLAFSGGIKTEVLVKIDRSKRDLSGSHSKLENILLAVVYMSKL